MSQCLHFAGQKSCLLVAEAKRIEQQFHLLLAWLVNPALARLLTCLKSDKSSAYRLCAIDHRHTLGDVDLEGQDESLQIG